MDPRSPEAGEAGLEAELARAREALQARDGELARLREELAALEEERRRVCDQYVASLDRATEVGNLYVTLRRLHGSLDRAEILEALREVVVNLVGSEEFAVLERRGEGFAVLCSMGLSAERLAALEGARGALGPIAAAGRLHLAGEGAAPDGEARDLTAWIPLRLGARAVGAVAVFRLLGQKPGLAPGDLELFEVLSSHAALALRCAALDAAAAERRPA